MLDWYSNGYMQFPDLQRHVGPQLMIQRGECNERQSVASQYALIHYNSSANLYFMATSVFFLMRGH